MHKGPKVTAAPLNIILEANGKQTGDQLVMQRRADEEARRQAEIAALPKYMNSRQRRALRKVLEKGAAANET